MGSVGVASRPAMLRPAAKPVRLVCRPTPAPRNAEGIPPNRPRESSVACVWPPMARATSDSATEPRTIASILTTPAADSSVAEKSAAAVSPLAGNLRARAAQASRVRPSRSTAVRRMAATPRARERRRVPLSALMRGSRAAVRFSPSCCGGLWRCWACLNRARRGPVGRLRDARGTPRRAHVRTHADALAGLRLRRRHSRDQLRRLSDRRRSGHHHGHGMSNE